MGKIVSFPYLKNIEVFNFHILASSFTEIRNYCCFRETIIGNHEISDEATRIFLIFLLQWGLKGTVMNQA